MNQCIVCGKLTPDNRKFCFGGCSSIKGIAKKKPWNINDSKMEVSEKAELDMKNLENGVFVVDKLKIG